MPEFDTGSYRLHYQWGNGYRPARPTVVMLHDGLGASGSWRSLPARLAQALDVNTLVYDRHGYGRSQKRASFPPGFMEAEVPHLLALLDHVEVERAFLLGHSDGGSISLLCAAWHGERVRAVVTEAAHTFVEPETRAGIQALVDLQARGKTPSWLYKLHGERAEDLLRAWSGQWLSEPFSRWNISAALPAVACPVLAIQGAGDEFGTRAQVDSILAGVPGATSWIVPGCGHTPHSQAEDGFLERVREFFAEWMVAGSGPATEV